MNLQNAIVVMFDSLGYRYLGCYGNTWIKTPNFDRFAREGVLFENSFSEGLPTVPVRRAMMTGRYTLPSSGWSPLSMEDTTIADLCWGRPIDSAIVYDSAPCRLPKFGYTRGFDKVWFTRGQEGDTGYFATEPLLHRRVEDYYDEDVLARADSIVGEGTMKTTLEQAVDYLKVREHWHGPEDRFVAKTLKMAGKYLKHADRNKQFFLWVDSFDPHEPWDPTSVWDPDMPSLYDPDYTGKDEFSPVIGPAEVYTEPQLHHIRMLYAELITQCDTELGKFLDTIRELGLEQSTLIMLVSDHGEPLGHGKHGHGIVCKCRPWPYDELVHTPMLLRAPGVRPGQRISAYVQCVDVAPTVCDWLGIGVHPDMQGKSLLPLVRGETEKLRDFAIAGYHKYSWAMYTDDWSYVHWIKTESRTASMFDIVAEGMVESSKYLRESGREDAPLQKEMTANVWDTHQLDDEDQWTCARNSKADVPEQDELYNRHTDPYQLKNVAAQHPDVARKLLQQLKDYMEELRG